MEVEEIMPDIEYVKKVLSLIDKKKAKIDELKFEISILQKECNNNR